MDFNIKNYFCTTFLQTDNKKSLQMLRESRHENLKMLIAPLSIKLSILKSTGGLSTVVQGFNNSYLITKINGHSLRPKKENMTFYDFITP